MPRMLVPVTTTSSTAGAARSCAWADIDIVDTSAQAPIMAGRRMISPPRVIGARERRSMMN
jgi:hypothetical protein